MRSSSRTRLRPRAPDTTTELTQAPRAGAPAPPPSPRAAPPHPTLAHATDALMALGVAPLALLMAGSAQWPLGLLLGAQAVLQASVTLRRLPGAGLLALALAHCAAAALAALAAGQHAQQQQGGNDHDGGAQ